MFEIRYAQGQGYFWRLRGTNGETLCHSEVYTAKASAESAIAVVRRLAPIAPVDDLTRR